MKNKTPSPIQFSNSPYLYTVVAMVAIGALILIFRPNTDVLDVFTALAPTTAAILAFMKSQETHLAVNSRLDEFIKNAGLAEHAKGMEEGRNAANERTDAIKNKQDQENK